MADLRVGILTIAEKWGKHLDVAFGFQTEDYLSKKYSLIQAELFINGAICPDTELLEAIANLKDGQVLHAADVVIAYKSSATLQYSEAMSKLERVAYLYGFVKIDYPEQIFGFNDIELQKTSLCLPKEKLPLS